MPLTLLVVGNNSPHLMTSPIRDSISFVYTSTPSSAPPEIPLESQQIRRPHGTSTKTKNNNNNNNASKRSSWLFSSGIWGHSAPEPKESLHVRSYHDVPDKRSSWLFNTATKKPKDAVGFESHSPRPRVTNKRSSWFFTSGDTKKTHKEDHDESQTPRSSLVVSPSMNRRFSWFSKNHETRDFREPPSPVPSVKTKKRFSLFFTSKENGGKCEEDRGFESETLSQNNKNKRFSRFSDSKERNKNEEDPLVSPRSRRSSWFFKTEKKNNNKLGSEEKDIFDTFESQPPPTRPRLASTNSLRRSLSRFSRNHVEEEDHLEWDPLESQHISRPSIACTDSKRFSVTEEENDEEEEGIINFDFLRESRHPQSSRSRLASTNSKRSSWFFSGDTLGRLKKTFSALQRRRSFTQRRRGIQCIC